MAVIHPESIFTVKVSVDPFEDLFEDIEEIVNEDLAEIEPLEDPEMTEEDVALYLSDINKIFKHFQLHTKTLQDYQILQQALENLLVPSCQYLLDTANQVPENIQRSIESMADRLSAPQNYVLYPSHSDQYFALVEDHIGLEVSKLGIFSNKLIEKEQYAQTMQVNVQEVCAQQDQLGNLTALSTAQLIQAKFWFDIEAIRRNLTTHMEMTPIMQKIHATGITQGQLLELSKRELNFVIFYGASQEAWDIIENLAATNASPMRPGS